MNNIRIIGKSKIIDNKYVYKDSIFNKNIFEYLSLNNFTSFPKIIDDKYMYISNIKIDDNILLDNLIKIISDLHSKTTIKKDIDSSNIYNYYKGLISKKLNEYNELFDKLIKMDYLNPGSYLLLINISVIFNALDLSLKYLEEFKDNSSSINYSYIHNNLSLKHILYNNSYYLISWDRSKFALSIKDLDNLYRNNYNLITIKDIINKYQNDINTNLLYSLILIPDSLNDLDYHKVINIIDYLSKTINDLNDSNNLNKKE